MSQHAEASASPWWSDPGVRLVFMIAAIALAWVGLQRHTAFLEYARTTGELHTGIWSTFVGVLALAGVAAGFASRLPSRGPYSWGRALILVLPPLLMLLPVALLTLDAWSPPGWLVSFVGTSVVQPVLSLLVGLGISAGFPTGRTTHDPSGVLA